MSRCAHLVNLAPGVDVPCLICLCAKSYVNHRAQMRLKEARLAEHDDRAELAESLVERMIAETERQ